MPIEVSHAMSNLVLTIGPEHTVRDAARSMADRKVGAAIVIDPDSPGFGIITERDILNAIAETVSTDFPRGDAGNLTSLLPLVLQRNITRVVLGYPGYVDLPTNPLANYLLIPKRAAIRAEAKKLFGAQGQKGWYVGSTDPYPPASTP